MSINETATSVTGRDGYIRLQALLYAVARIQTLPEDQQEYSNMVDMCAIARAMNSPPIWPIVWGVELHVGHEIDLWPAGGGNEVGGAYTDVEIDAKEAQRAKINAAQVSLSSISIELNAPPSNVIKFLDGNEDGTEVAA